jgi:hypothetical protein
MNKLSVLEKGRQSALVVVLTLILFSSTTASATTYWSKIFEISAPAQAIQQTSDGGFIVTGGVYSIDFGPTDFRVMKLNVDGSVAWQRTYSGSGNNVSTDIQTTLDGGYILAGKTSPDNYNAYLWILKLDKDGNGQWQKTYGAGRANSILQTSDGGYITVGVTSSFGAGKEDFWVLKLDKDGNVQWQKTYGGTDDDEANSVQQTLDGGYIVAGMTHSFGAGQEDIWILKLNLDGDVQWQKTYGGPGNDLAKSIQLTSDRGYIVAGGTSSFGSGGEDAWVLKIDKDGNLQWQKTYGGTTDEEANVIRQTTDGGYVVGGYTDSFGPTDQNAWLVKLDSNGDVIWQNTYGAGRINSIQETLDGGYITAGLVWVLFKLDNHGDIAGCSLPEASYALATDTSVIGQNTNITRNDSNIAPQSSNITSKDTNAVEYTVCLSPINPGITLNPTEISFGPILPGDSMDESVLLTNEGNQDVTIGVLTTPYLPLSISTDNCSGQTLVPGGRCTITVRFSPTSDIDYPSLEIFNIPFQILNIPLKDLYQSIFTVFLFERNSIALSTPPNNAYFDSCSLYAPPSFAWNVAKEFTSYQIMIFLEQPSGSRSQLFRLRTSGATTETVIPSSTWKKILSAFGVTGGKLKWEVFGTLPPSHSNGTILIGGGVLSSEYRFINIKPSQPVGNPTISPTSKSSLPELSWQNNCNIKFKVWFGSDDNFNSQVAYTFNTKNPVENEGKFARILTAGQWKSIRKLVGDENDSTIYWYVESWDGLGSYTKTDVMSFVLAD